MKRGVKVENNGLFTVLDSSLHIQKFSCPHRGQKGLLSTLPKAATRLPTPNPKVEGSDLQSCRTLQGKSTTERSGRSHVDGETEARSL